MSIAPLLAAATGPTTAPAVSWVANAVMGAWAAVALAAAARLGVFRPRTADGPIRIPRDRPVWPLAVVIFGGLLTWTVAASLLQETISRTGSKVPASNPSELTPTQYALLSTLPPAAVFLALLAGDWLYHPAAVGWLGLGGRKLPRDLIVGGLATAAVLPALYWVLVASEWFYQAVGYRHPAEHDMLRAMKGPGSPLVRWALIFAAVVVAPVVEEYLFRGHLQTLLRHGFIRLTTPNPEPPEVEPPVVPDQGTATLPYEDAVVSKPAGQTTGQTWAAILMTSVLFTYVHPGWTAPAISLLSISLGYVYERTGSLWAAITLHALFNTTSTVLYLG